MRSKLLLGLACAMIAISTPALARSHHQDARATFSYDPHRDPNAVFVAGSYAGSDPDPNIRAALAREFGRGI